MNQAPAGPRTARTPSTESGPAVVLRQLTWSLTELIIGGGLLAAHFLFHVQNELFHDVTRGGAIGSIVVAVLTARFRYAVGAGQLTARQQLRRSCSVDLARLT